MRARLSRAEGEPKEALDLLASLQRKIPFGLHWSNTFLNQPSERLLLADLLLESGQPEKSIPMYGSLDYEGFSFFHAQGLLGLARALVELERIEEARPHLAKFREIMTGCDEEYLPYLAAADELEAAFKD